MALCVASLLFALFLCEVGLRILDRGRPIPWPIQCRRPDLYEAWPPIGYRLRPGLRTTYDYPLSNPRTLKVIANRAGFRMSREFDEPDDRPRVVVTGDSFVFGEGVEAEERFTDIVERDDPDLRVDNLGMPGFGPDLMLRALEVVGLAPSPDAVVICYYTDDFHRVHPQYAGAGFPLPKFELVDGELVDMPYPVPGLLDRLHLVNVVRRRLDRNWEVGDRWALNRAVFGRMVAECRKVNAAVGVVFLSGPTGFPQNLRRREWLAEVSSEEGVPLLDLAETIQAAGSNVFIPDNPHLNPAGHALVGEHLRRFLRERVLPH